MLNGEWVELFESGKIASIIHYDKNKMSGNYKTFYSNWNTKEEIKYMLINGMDYLVTTMKMEI